MKKFLFFAIALVAGALAFTSCDKKVDSPLVGTWEYITDPAAPKRCTTVLSGPVRMRSTAIS